MKIIIKKSEAEVMAIPAQDKFDKQLRELLPAGKVKILAAVSGGADSMCLLHLLYNSSLAPEVSVAHMNFSLRGADSDADQEYVRRWATDHSLGFFTRRVDTVSYAQIHSVSVEMAARDLRYKWFGELIAREGFDYLAVAHNANDNAETLLLNLTRGTGMKGLCGIPQRNGFIIRPLLGWTRKEIETYARKHEICYRTDKTNLETDYSRNRIRNEVFPQLEKINPAAVKTLNRDIRYFNMGNRILSALALEKGKMLEERAPGRFPEREKETGIHGEPGLVTERGFGSEPDLRGKSGFEGESECKGKSESKDKTGMKGKTDFGGGDGYDDRWISRISLSRLLKEDFYEYWLYELMSPYGFNGVQIEEMASAVKEKNVKKFLSAAYLAVVERGFLKVYPSSVLQETPPAVFYGWEGTEIRTGEVKEFRFGERTLRFTAVDPECFKRTGASSGSHNVLYLSADRLRFPLLCRPPRPGDRFRPYGMKGTKKVSDYLTDRKVAHAVRSGVPVLLNAPAGAGQSLRPEDGKTGRATKGEIICLAGLQISEDYKITPATGKALKIEMIF